MPYHFPGCLRNWGTSLRRAGFLYVDTWCTAKPTLQRPRYLGFMQSRWKPYINGSFNHHRSKWSRNLYLQRKRGSGDREETNNNTNSEMGELKIFSELSRRRKIPRSQDLWSFRAVVVRHWNVARLITRQNVNDYAGRYSCTLLANSVCLFVFRNHNYE